MIVIIDNGIGFGFTKNIQDVAYCCVSNTPFPNYDYLIGAGFDNVRKVYTPVELGNILRQADKILVVDNEIKIPYNANYIMSNDMIILEYSRDRFVKELSKYKVRIVNSEEVVGISDLVNIMERKQWKGVVKVDSIFRGVVETTVFDGDSNKVLNFAERVLKDFGFYGVKYLKFKIEDYIEDAVEYTLDLFVDNGRIKRPYLFGTENGKGYMCLVTDSKLESFVDVIEQITMKYKYNSALSIEMLYNGNIVAVTDIAVRWGMPFSLMYPVVIANWEELITGWNDGVEPVFRGKFVGARIITGKGWDVIEDNERYNYSRPMKDEDGNIVNVPFGGGDYNVIGLDCGYGRTFEDVINMINVSGWDKGLEVINI